ncbi:MAG: FtsX-like permease family protein, partial [bacterium]|nr:FtsX-like permease family protein [bacterium]
ISSAIVLLILFIACLNYINLSTARYTSRVKEIGVRKVLGANRNDLIGQFLGESSLVSFISLPIALVLTILFLPQFNSIMGKQLAFSNHGNSLLAPGMFLVILSAGFISGIFPALFISAIPPVKALGGLYRSGSTPSLLRKSLMVFQFAISILLIICSLIVFGQLNHMKSKRPGFDKENIVSVPIYDAHTLNKYEVLKNEFAQEKNVLSVSASNFFPGKNMWNVDYRREGDTEQSPGISYIIIDHDFIATSGIKLVEGRGFSRDFPGDIGRAYILNQSAVKEFGWKSPIGKTFKLGNGKKGTVIGVVEDFHFESMHRKIRPTVLYLVPQDFAYISIKLAPGTVDDIAQTLE